MKFRRVAAAASSGGETARDILTPLVICWAGRVTWSESRASTESVGGQFRVSHAISPPMGRDADVATSGR
jgi:hypothetical protein